MTQQLRLHAIGKGIVRFLFSPFRRKALLEDKRDEAQETQALKQGQTLFRETVGFGNLDAKSRTILLDMLPRYDPAVAISTPHTVKGPIYAIEQFGRNVSDTSQIEGIIGCMQMLNQEGSYGRLKRVLDVLFGEYDRLRKENPNDADTFIQCFQRHIVMALYASTLEKTWPDSPREMGSQRKKIIELWFNALHVGVVFGDSRTNALTRGRLVEQMEHVSSRMTVMIALKRRWEGSARELNRLELIAIDADTISDIMEHLGVQKYVK